MGKKDNFDNEILGQMTLEDLYRPPERLVAVSRIFARARKEMSLAEQKTFVYALSQLRFTEQAESNYVKLEKKTLANILGINSDSDHLSVDLYAEIKDLTKHSYIEINEKDLDLQSNGFIITALTRFKNILRLRFNDEYMGLFTGLSTDYITMWSADIFQMSTRRSVQFYEFLRQNTDSRLEINDIGLGIKAFKEMFGIPETGKGSYMREKGGFNRTEFEKRIILPICEDLKHCRMIKLILQPDGKPYEKVKKGNRVFGYRFYWTFNARPGIPEKPEVKEVPEPAPKTPAPAPKSKRQPKQKENAFNNFPQRKYDSDFFAQLERAQHNRGD